MKKIIYFLIPFFFSCSVQPDIQKEPNEAIIINDEKQGDLSEVVTKLLDQPVDGYVLIHYTTKEYNSIEKARADQSPPKSIVGFDTEKLQLHTPLSIVDDHRYNWGSPLVFREVIADHGDVVEVNTTDVDLKEPMGHGGLGADYMFSVVTFVRKMDLVPVLSVPCKKEFADKTQIKLYPGVAVGTPWDGDHNKRAVSIQQMHFEFSIPDKLLALSYKPILKVFKDLDEEMMLDEKANLFLGGAAFGSVSEIRFTRLRTPVRYDKGAKKHTVELVENGIEMTLQTDGDLVKAYIPTNDRVVMTPKYDIPPRWYYRVSEGTPVYWDDGRRAGAVRQFFGYQSNEVPYGLNPKTQAKELLDKMKTIEYDSLIVFRKGITKAKTIRIHSLNGAPYNGWSRQTFSDTDHKYRYTKFEDGLAIWQIGYFDNGELGHDFHMKDGMNYGSQKMWQKGGGYYIDTYFLEGAIQHGKQLRWHGNGVLSRDALFEKGTLVFEVLFDAEGKIIEKKGAIPEKYNK